MARLQQVYKDEVAPALKSSSATKSVMEVPRITKITLNMGVGEAVGDKEGSRARGGRHEKIAVRSRFDQGRAKSIAGFQDRDGYPIGCMVTLRGPRMFEFLDRLITIACRVSATSVVSRQGFSTVGNYNIGVKEQIIFPEIEYDKIDAAWMDITITTTAKTDEEGRAPRRVQVPLRIEVIWRNSI